jgi:putative acetyltransferase
MHSMTTLGADVAYSVIAARPHDLAMLPSIELAAARLLAGHAPESILSEATSAADFERACRDDHLWVALHGDAPVGFAHVKVFETGVAHLDELDVHPDHGRRGLGRWLVGAVRDWAVRNHFDSVTLSTFRDVPWNMPFYAKLGFTVIPAVELTPALKSLVDDETRRGLDVETRVVMRLGLRGQPTQGMRARPATREDHEPLLALWERSVRATHDFLTSGDIVALRPLVAVELAGEAIEWWVLEIDGATAGFLGFANDAIEALFIDPGRRGEGGGTLLVEHAQRLARGVLTVDVNEQNESARRFYERRGFAVTGRSPTDSGGRPFPILHMRRLR